MDVISFDYFGELAHIKYFNKLSQRMKDKFTYSFTKTEYGYKGEWFKKLNDSNGIFEFMKS